MCIVSPLKVTRLLKKPVPPKNLAEAETCLCFGETRAQACTGMHIDVNILACTPNG